jgi:lipopolysaccharide/colanic/teichoic acid biosynthesis glycosyltransferase
MNSVHNLEVSFKIIPELTDLKKGYQTAALRSGILWRIFPSHMRSWEWLVKRIFDAVVSFLILIVFLPVWLLIAFLIKIVFKAHPLINETYMGKMQKLIQVHKFRLYKSTVESKVILSDTPATLNWLGRFLKYSGLERIPMLFNVLRGEISLIGPQPLSLPTFVELSNKFLLLPKRLNIKPGLLSFARIKGKFKISAETFKDHFADDLYYMENMSLFLDLKVLWGALVSLVRRQSI